MIGLAIALNYIDRGALSVAAPLVQAELGLSATGYGLVVSAFFWTYVPSLILAGWLADRMSVHRLMAVGVLIWSTATILTGFAGGIAGLVLLRLLMGVGEGVAFPCASKLIARVPEARRGTANIAISAGLSLGPLIGTLAGGVLLVAYGWREMFIVFGVVTMLWLLPWSRFRNDAGLPVPHIETVYAVGYRALLRNPQLWAMTALHFTATYSLYFVLAWLPLYLVKVRGFDIAHMALLTGLFYAVQAASGASATLVCDRLIGQGRDASQTRRVLLLATIGLSTAGFVAVPLMGSSALLIAALVVTAIGFGPVSVVLFAAGQTLAGAASTGRWIGVQSSVGNLAGITGPVITGLIVDRAGYAPAFALAAAISLIGGLVFLFGIRRIAPVRWAAA